MARSTNPFRYFDSSPEVIRTVVMMYVKYPLSLRNVEYLLAERGIDMCYKTVRLLWNRFGSTFAAETPLQDRLPLGSALAAPADETRRLERWLFDGLAKGGADWTDSLTR